MGNFSQKVDKFIDIFLNQNGYVKVVQGLQNTLLIAITGLIIGIVIGTLIATVRVIPKYKTLPRVLNHICSKAESNRSSGFHLSLVNRLNSTSHNFRNVCTTIQTKYNHRNLHSGNLYSKDRKEYIVKNKELNYDRSSSE